MLSSIKYLYTLLDNKSRLTVLTLTIGLIFSAAIDVVGIASIMPFLAVLTDPGLIQRNQLLSLLHASSGLPPIETFLRYLAVLYLIILVLSLGFKVFFTRKYINFSLEMERWLSARLLDYYLKQPYIWHVRRRSSESVRILFTTLSNVINGCLLPLMTLFSQCAVISFILMLLVYVDITLAISSVTILAGIYSLLYTINSRRLLQIGKAEIAANGARFSSATDAIRAYKQIAIDDVGEFFLDRFSRPARDYSKLRASSLGISQLPRYGLELVAYSGIIFIILYLMGTGRDLTSILPVLALYALAGLRIMPAMQQVYNSLVQLRYSRASLDELMAEFKVLGGVDLKTTGNPLQLDKSIRLSQISFQYPGAKEFALKDVSFEITLKDSIGIVGETGSGKTTLVDVICGLLTPSSGNISVDDVPQAFNQLKSLRNYIGYVPQDLYFIDDSISANIAFGVPIAEIDHNAVVSAAKMACLHEFIVDCLEHGYDTHVGEGGKRLSGGQRQRLGIARALYRSPRILVFDEATSALDMATEEDIVESLRSIRGNFTMIIISHRPAALLYCDKIIALSNGNLIRQGSYHDVFGPGENS